MAIFARYRLDWNANDSSGNWYNLWGTVSAWVDGKQWQAAFINGTGWLNSTTVTVPTWNNPRTMSYLLYKSSTWDDTVDFHVYWGNESTNAWVYIYDNSTGLLTWAYWYSWSSNYKPSSWAHVVVTQTWWAYIMYIDSKVYVSQSWTVNVSWTKFSIGRALNSSANQIVWTVDDVIADNAVWTPAQVKNQYAFYYWFI